MNNYRKFAIALILIELILIIGGNVLIRRTLKEDAGRSYRVDIRRAVEEMQQGIPAQDINLDNYKTIIAISEFEPGRRCDNDYIVEDVNGTLYRYEYRQENNRNCIWIINIVLGVFFLGSIILIMYIGVKVIRPFNDMSALATELAKGNLSVPLKAQKSKFFGQFLWGMDMLREKLEQDKIRELELIKDKKTLILSLSHDIKTPLEAIDLYTKALSRNLYDSDRKRLEAVMGIEKNTEEIKKYVNEITNASREDFLSMEVVNKEFYLSEVLQIILNYYREKMLLNHTEFTLDDVSDCLLYGDLERTVEVMQNVIENALKYGDGKKIHIYFKEEEECKLIEIENSGCNLGKEEVSNIFDSFYRGSNSEGVKGSGLGLYICKQLLHKMDGEIYAAISGNQFIATIVLRKM